LTRQPNQAANIQVAHQAPNAFWWQPQAAAWAAKKATPLAAEGHGSEGARRADAAKAADVETDENYGNASKGSYSPAGWLSAGETSGEGWSPQPPVPRQAAEEARKASSTRLFTYLRACAVCVAPLCIVAAQG